MKINFFLKNKMRSMGFYLKNKKNESGLLRTNIAILFLFCFFLHMPKIAALPIITQFVSYAIPLFYILLNASMIKRFSSRQWIILFLTIILSMLSLLLPVFYGTEDFSYFSTFLALFKKIIIYIALFFLINNHYGKKMSAFYFMYYFALTHVVYVFGTILLVAIPSISNIWFSIIDKGTMMGNELGESMFRIGWEGFSGFRLTLYCTISVVFALYLRFGSEKPLINFAQFLLLFIGCIVGNMFYGRSGLVVSLLLSIVAFVWWNRKNMKRIMGASIMVVVLVTGVAMLRFIPELDSWFKWMSSPIVNLVTTGDMKDSSFNKLQKMQQVEMEENTFVFGDGYYNMDGRYYMETDAGFMRNVLFWGIIGSTIAYVTLFYSIIGFSRFSKLLLFQIIIIFFAFEYKGAVYYEFIPFAFVISSSMPSRQIQIANKEEHD